LVYFRIAGSKARRFEDQNKKVQPLKQDAQAINQEVLRDQIKPRKPKKGEAQDG
jgi:hypothetical protein